MNNNLEEKEEEIIKKEDEILYENFEDMSFLENNLDLLKGIFDYGFTSPSKIQSLTLRHIYEGKDLIAQSQSGTGKTGAFVIGTLLKINPEFKKPQAIIIANTRELSTQICKVATELGKYMKINCELCIGGVPNDFKKIRSSHILIGTPGRMNDLISRKQFDIRKINLFVIDEADVLLKDDFSEQIKSIFTEMRKNTQICIFSATYPKKVLDLAMEIMNDPVTILLKKEELSLDLIKQYRIYIGNDDMYKYPTLKDLYKSICISQCMIFVNSKEKANMLKIHMEKDGHTVGMIHGDLSQEERCNILKEFRLNIIRVLISTDVLSRGIDVQQIGLVINYDLPTDYAEYIHRIGRSGRFGKIGVAINLVTDRDLYLLKEIEKFYKIDIKPMPVVETINGFLSGLNGHLNLNTN